MSKKVIIVGSGIGGLCTALRLSELGYQVEILEKNATAGGRLNSFTKDGFTFDLGPTFFGMSYEFRELFHSVNEELPFEIEPLDILYKVFFAEENKSFRIYKDLQKLAKEFEENEADFELKVEKYLNQAKLFYKEIELKIIKKNFKSILHHLLNISRVSQKHLPKILTTFRKELDDHFDSKEVKIIFSLVASLIGSTPFHLSGVYSLLNYLELQHDGYWTVKGGMYNIVIGLLSLLEKRNVVIHYNVEITEVIRIGGEIVSFVDQHGKKWTGDIYVVNSDAAAFRGKFLKRVKYSEAKLRAMQWTPAAVTVYLGVKGQNLNLEHHNFFLNDHFIVLESTHSKKEVGHHLSYYYVNYASKTNPDCAPLGHENVFILCPVDDLRSKANWNDVDDLVDRILKDLGERIDFDFCSKTVVKSILTPLDWEKRFHLYKGSSMGLTHGYKQMGALRPANKDEEFKNLYYVGSNTLPGAGLSMVVVGSKLVLDRILEDHPISLT